MGLIWASQAGMARFPWRHCAHIWGTRRTVPSDEEHGHVGRLLGGEVPQMAHDHAGGGRRVQVHVVHAHRRGDHALQVRELVERR